MRRATKSAIILTGSLLLTCLCGVAVVFGAGFWSFAKFLDFADQSTTEDPQEVAHIASEIAEFEIPEGFSKQYGMKVGTFSLVQYTTSKGDTFIFVTQFPAGTSINPDEMMREIRDSSRKSDSPWCNIVTRLIEQRSVTIRGAEAILSVSEGTSENGQLYRMANAKFQGRGQGPSLLMIVGPADDWELQMAEDFIGSIR